MISAHRTAHDMAYMLVGYISSDKEIKAMVDAEFTVPIGLGRVAEIRKSRARQDKVRTRQVAARDALADDGMDFKVKGMLPPPGPSNDLPPPPHVIDDDGLNYSAMTSKDIIHHIAKAFDLKYADIISNARTRDVMLARRVAMYALFKRGNSMAQTGRWLCVDHSSVIHGVEQFERFASLKMRAVADKFIQAKVRGVATGACVATALEPPSHDPYATAIGV